MIDHHIQRDILLRLAASHGLRFSELKQDGMENNAFMYHLRELIKRGYVSQDDAKIYTLSPQGMSYFDTLTLTNVKPRRQPKLISIVALRNREGQYLMARRKLHPNLDTWMFPSGKQHFGESPDNHARREIQEQFGGDDDVTRRGLMDLRIYHGDELVSHLTAHVYYGESNMSAPAPTRKFEYAWRHVDNQLAVTPGTHELAKAIEHDTGLFFLSLDVGTD